MAITIVTRLAAAWVASLPAFLPETVAQQPSTPQVADTAKEAIGVQVDPRVELMSLVFRLAGSPEYNQARVPSYAVDVDKRFETFKQHAAVKTAQRLRRERGVSYDAVMSIAIHVKDAESLGELVPFDPLPAALDRRWTVEDAREFLEQTRALVAAADFDAFLDSHRELYDITESRFRRLIEKEGLLAWFNRFFGDRPGAGFTVCLGMLNGGACYGPRIERAAGDEELYCVLGVWSTDENGLPRFDAEMLDTVVHEFCHSYVNPLVYRHQDQLERAGTTLYPHVATVMREQAYGNWTTMMHESLVRASVVRYVADRRGPAAADREIRDQVGRGFHWMPELAALLETYETERERYPDLESFFPRIVEFFDDYAPAFDRRMAEQGRSRPRVVSMTPQNGAADVEPSVTEIVITFDRPMSDGGWSFVGGGPNFPEIAGQPSYDETKTVITLPVRLKPGWRYEFWLNRGRYQSFRSADGTPLESIHVQFKTTRTAP